MKDRALRDGAEQFVIRWSIRSSAVALQQVQSSAALGNQKSNHFRDCSLAPRVGLEPTTLRLTAECSTIELSRIARRGTMRSMVDSLLHTRAPIAAGDLIARDVLPHGK